MNEQFENLPGEKKQKIINAAMEVFATNDYKHASTDEMARKAGISKGMLFYYFHNKKSLYLYVYTYCYKLIREQVVDEQFSRMNDYFEIMEYSARKKYALLEQNPYLLEFTVRAYYSTKEDVSDAIQSTTQMSIDNIVPDYFSQVDYSKFRKGIDVEELTRMFLWMTDGYINERKRMGIPIQTKDIMDEFQKWVIMFRKIAYKDEYTKSTD